MAPFNHSSRVHPTNGFKCNRSKFGKRRSGSSFTPLSDSNLIAWYDPSVGEGTGYTLDGSSETDDIYDLSGNSNTLSQITTGFTINSASQNGLDTFNVSTDRMEGSISGTNNQPWTIICAFRYTGTPNDIGEAVLQNSAGSAWSWNTDHGDFNTPPNSIVRLIPGSGSKTTQTATDTNWHILALVYDGADSAVYVDGTVEESYYTDNATDTTQVALANLRWGLGLSSGEFGDLIFVQGNVASSNLEDYVNYLSNKWGISV